MKYAPADLAKALYLASRGQTGKDAEATIRRFIGFLKEKRLLHHLPRVMRQVPAVAARIEDAEALHVETARPLEDRELAALLKEIGAGPDTQVRLRVAPELLGGVRLRRKGKVLDATIKGKLAGLRRTLGRSTA